VSRGAGTRIAVVIIVMSTALTLAACAINNDNMKVGSAPYDQGSGKVATETRPLEGFHAVSASQGVRVSVSAGTSSEASVSGDDNLLAHVTTSVADGTLFVSIEGSIETRNPLTVDVTSTTLIDAIAADAGSTVDSEDLQVAGLTLQASSGSTVRGGGQASSVEATATSGSTIDLRNLEAREARVDASVGSTIHVNASDAVSGSSTSGSTVQVSGSPPTVDVTADPGSTVSQ
jgi:Putative auto-transporter adhesin, head GIN domain